MGTWIVTYTAKNNKRTSSGIPRNKKQAKEFASWLKTKKEGKNPRIKKVSNKNLKRL